MKRGKLLPAGGFFPSWGGLHLPSAGRVSAMDLTGLKTLDQFVAAHHREHATGLTVDMASLIGVK